MENHHCAMMFAILSRKGCNVLAGLQPEEQRHLRKVVISSILCTDMVNHFNLTQVGREGGRARGGRGLVGWGLGAGGRRADGRAE